MLLRTTAVTLVLVGTSLGPVVPHEDLAQEPQRTAVTTPLLRRTAHPSVPPLDELWLVPGRRSPIDEHRRQATRLSSAVKLARDGNHAAAAGQINPAELKGTTLAHYAAYHEALATFRLGRLDEARRGFAAVRAGGPVGYLADAAVMREAEVAEAQADFPSAEKFYEELAGRKTVTPEQVLFRLGSVRASLGDTKGAADAYHRLYFEFPLAEVSTAAGLELQKLRPANDPRDAFDLKLGRALRLFGARRYADARASFEELRPAAEGDNREVVALRIAESDFYLGRHRAAADALRPYIDGAKRKAEAQFFYLMALRELGNTFEAIERTHRLVNDFPDQSWAEEALYNLARLYIVDNDDAQADVVFRQLYSMFPQGTYAERAAWKIGWWAYKHDRFEDTATTFEAAAARFARGDTRPAFLYWSARARERLGQHAVAIERYRLAIADYKNSYYGRLAVNRLAALEKHAAMSEPTDGVSADPVVVATSGTQSEAVAPTSQTQSRQLPTADLIRSLLAVELYDEAMNELLYAQTVWGDSPAIQATMAWIYYRTGELRRGITLMRRAYPQFLSSGDPLPAEVLKVIFPLDYWDLIKRQASARGLDPYIVAALVAQESTFQPTIRSPANAYGLMQILPGTGRQLARSIGIRRFNMSMLTSAESNVRLGTTYVRNLLERFDGGMHYVLASYNAGPHRVDRWIDERPGVERDEFIDDIPFPETQNYVKRILGTAEDYRHLYGQLGAIPNPGRPAPAAGSASVSPSSSPRSTSSVSKKPSSSTKKKPTAKKKTTSKSKSTKRSSKKPRR